VAMD